MKIKNLFNLEKDASSLKFNNLGFLSEKEKVILQWLLEFDQNHTFQLHCQNVKIATCGLIKDRLTCSYPGQTLWFNFSSVMGQSPGHLHDFHRFCDLLDIEDEYESCS